MISVTHFAFEKIAISKEHAAQDRGDQDGEGQGQVRSFTLKKLIVKFQEKSPTKGIMISS